MHRTFNHYLRNFVTVSAPFKSINLRVISSECFYRKPLDGVNWLRIPADQDMRFFFLHTINLLVSLLGSADHYYSALVLCD